MSQNADRFTGRVAEYERYRLRYPVEVMTVMRERCGLRPEDLIADVGAGTGMVAELFLQAGHRVIAIEPNAEMRAVCAGLTEKYAGLRVMDATAETTGLEDASIDLVSVGRAFQWFDRERALAEFRRILKPGRWMVLLTNRPAYEASDKMRGYEEVLKVHGVDHVEKRGDLRRFDDLQPYGDGETFEVRMPAQQSLSFEQLAGQTQSYSIAPLPGHPKYDGMQAALKDFFLRWSAAGIVRLDTSCDVIGWRTPV
jgi:SAM-dependent methyltransferase